MTYKIEDDEWHKSDSLLIIEIMDISDIDDI